MAEASVCSLETQVHVVSTILNRVEDDRYPDTLHEVVFQYHQYSPTFDGGLYKHDVTDKVKLAVEMALKEDTTDGCLGFLVIELSNSSNVKNILKHNVILFKSGTVSFTIPKGDING